MIQIIAGLQGAGKTKSLIDLANAESKTTHGHLVYVDADNSHILQLSHKIRLSNRMIIRWRPRTNFLVLFAAFYRKIMIYARSILMVC